MLFGYGLTSKRQSVFIFRFTLKVLAIIEYNLPDNGTIAIL